MKIECVKEKLKEGVSKVEKISGKKLSLPVLENIILETTPTHLVLRATNLDVGVEIQIPGKVQTEGRVAVSGIVLGSLTNNLPDQKVILEKKDNNLSVSTKSSSTLIKTIPHEENPSIPAVSKKTPFTIKTNILLEGLKSVWYSASVSSMKPELSSI